jgi:hypothetical protein
MTETSAGTGTAPARPGLAARLVGTLFSPKDTFAAVAARPRWFGAMAVAIVVMGAAQFVLLSTDVGQQLALDQQIGTIEAFGVTISDEQYAQMEQGMENARYTGPIFSLIFVPVITAMSAGLLHVMFGLIGGGNGTFKQMYAISAHASIIGALQLVFTTVVTLAAGRAAGANLAVFTPTLEDTTFTYRLLSTIDMFYVWSTFVTAVGVAVLYKKRTSTVAMVLFGIYLAIALIIAFARSGS